MVIVYVAQTLLSVSALRVTLRLSLQPYLIDREVHRTFVGTADDHHLYVLAIDGEGQPWQCDGRPTGSRVDGRLPGDTAGAGAEEHHANVGVALGEERQSALRQGRHRHSRDA